ncbi:MAG: fumarate/nitrate reduction transcriptional regulator Fnr [Pontibacterium sp.]
MNHSTTFCTSQGKTNERTHGLPKVHCQTCSLSTLCLPVSLDNQEMTQLDEIVQKNKPHKKNSFLFEQGERFENVFVVRAGSIKTYALDETGQEQITGFYFPGEFVGLEGLDGSEYPAYAKALETTSVCQIPFEQLDALSGDIPRLRQQVFKTLSRHIQDDQQMHRLLSNKTAEERLATFLVKLSQRFKNRGYSATHFRLSMPRQDIANYLGMAVETVSRVLTRFQKQELIGVDGKEIELKQIDALYHLSGECVGH